MPDGRRTERRVLAVLGVALAFGLYRFATRYWDYGVAAGELPQAVQDYRAAGLPWTAADLETGCVPKAENAATPLHRAISALPDDVPYDAYQNGTIFAILPRYANAMALAHEAAKRSRLDFIRDWDLGPNLLMPEHGRIKGLARLLAARAESRAKQGDDAGALDDLEDARRLAVLVGQEPDIIAALVSAACHGYALASARVCLAAGAASPARMARYRHWLEAPTPEPDLHRALRGEVYATVAFARNADLMGIGRGLLPASDIDLGEPDTPEVLAGHYSHEPLPKMRHGGTPENTRTQAYLARCLQMWTELARETNGLTDSVDRIGQRALAIGDRHAAENRMSHMFDAILLPAFTRLGDANRGIEARRNLSLAYADALILHARTGRWPTSVATLDPLGTGTLKVRFDGKRFRVWSVGRDGKDGGGLTNREAYAVGRKSDDEVAAYPPLPR